MNDKRSNYLQTHEMLRQSEEEALHLRAALQREMASHRQTSKAADSIASFCKNHGISPSTYFNLKKARKGPREMRVGNRVLISKEAQADWRREREEDARRLKDGTSGFGNLRQRLGRSPGKGDAVVKAWSEGNAAAVSRHNAWRWEQYRDRRQAWIV
jgi:hypothetical protein